MKENVYTYPISMAFKEKDGCPFCRLYSEMEAQMLDYSLGGAMMEPDVRQVTNKIGFCEKHYHQMLRRRGRLQLALMLESHIADVNETVLSDKLFRSNKSKGEKAAKITDSCFICDKIEWGMSRMIDTLYNCYETQMDFRKMFNEQPMFCIPHFEMLATLADKKKMCSYYGEFLSNLTRITQNYSKTLHEDLKKYCSMYDYRNNTKNADWGNSKDSVERTISFLTGTVID